MKSREDQRGFILVEFIISLILIGIIGVFTSLFIYTGVNGYLNAKEHTEAALKAQVALDRIRLELLNIEEISTFDVSTADHTIVYKSEVLSPGLDRTLKYHSDVNKQYITIKVDTGPEYKLLNNVSSFAMVMSTDNLDGVDGAKEEVANIGVSFTIGKIGKAFEADIYPRNMLEDPSP